MSARLSDPLKTPSGFIFRNRLVKAAMAESLADQENDPGDRFIILYDTWSKGGWGAVLTGELEVSTIYMGHPHNISVKPTSSLSAREKWKRWALTAQQNNTPALVQLVHPGRQSPGGAGNRSFFSKSIAPSAVPVNLGEGIPNYLASKLLFGTPRAMTVPEIEEVVQQFAAAAKLVYESGFSGVQIHAAHGFLLTQFLSPNTNFRTDAYGGSPAKRARIVVDIIHAIRAVAPKTFCVGIKLNSADVGGCESLADSLEQVALIIDAGIDFLEVSGGTMENMRMSAGDEVTPKGKFEGKSARTVAREAFFIDYARAVRERHPDVLLMVTGGFRSRSGMQAALDSGACDLVGLGRPTAVWPSLAKEVILNKEVGDDEARCDLALVRGNWLVRKLGMKIVGAGVDVLYYAGMIKNMSEGKGTRPPPEGA